tara:strand:+ start:135 stop:2726 length:2592 start_codon:yes stop_codon:yes gene_type:complete
MANGLQDFLGVPNPFGGQPNMEPAGPAMEPQPLAYDPMNTGQGSMGMGMGAGGPGATNFTSDTGFSSDVDFKERLLNPETESDKILALEATANAGDPNKSPDEKRQGWRETILNMRMMDTYDIPTQQQIITDIKTDMLDMGIDLDAYSKINRSGDAYIAAGNTLTEASRAGYTPLQAISKALGAYGAADRASKLPDPNQVNMALQLYGMAGDTRKAMLDTRAAGLEEGTYVVGPKWDEYVMTLNGAQLAALNQMGVSYTEAKESDTKATSYMWLEDHELTSGALNQRDYARLINKGVDVMEADPENINQEVSYAGADGLVQFGRAHDVLAAMEDTGGEDVRIVKDTDIVSAIDDRTGMKIPITNKIWIEEYNKSVKDPNYDMKFFPADDEKSPIPEIKFSSSPGSVEFSSGPASSPGQELTIGNIKNDKKATAATQKQEDAITLKVNTDFGVAKLRQEGIEETIGIAWKLLNGLEGTRKGGGGQRVVQKITGGVSVVSDALNFLTTKTANKPYVTKFQDAFLAGRDLTGENTLGDTPDDPDTFNVSGAWDQVKLTESSPLWESLKQIGLTDLQEMNTLAFNLAIASLRAQGIDGKLITDKKIIMQMRALGLGPDTKTNEEAVAGLKTFLANEVSKYDQYKKGFFTAGLMDLGGNKSWVPGERNVPGGWATSERTQVNPFVHKNYARVESVADDGTTIYESTGVVPFFDTGPINERLSTNVSPLGTVNQQGNAVIRVNDDPSTIASYYMKDKDWFNTRPLNIPTATDNPGMSIPTGMSSYGQMAVTFAEKRSEAHRRIVNDGYMPGSPDYKREMSAVLGNLYEQFALNYFGEEAMDPKSTSPQRIAFDTWFGKAASLPLTGDIK